MNVIATIDQAINCLFLICVIMLSVLWIIVREERKKHQ